MGSPFPGMDPYLEGALWHDVHQALATQVRRQLVSRLKPRYVARLATRFVAELDQPGTVQILHPDVDVTEAPPVREPAAAYRLPMAEHQAGSPPPLVLDVPVPAQLALISVEIRDVQGNRLVTSIEILSPVNKRDVGYAEYQQKRWTVIQAPAHLLEIDLLRPGRRPVALDRVDAADRPRVQEAAYFVFLTRSAVPRRVEVRPIALRDPLPLVSVPLLDPDPDVPLDLNAAMRVIYDEAAYDLSIDYRRPPEPPLPAADAEWADVLLREHGLRTA